MRLRKRGRAIRRHHHVVVPDPVDTGTGSTAAAAVAIDPPPDRRDPSFALRADAHALAATDTDPLRCLQLGGYIQATVDHPLLRGPVPLGADIQVCATAAMGPLRRCPWLLGSHIEAVVATDSRWRGSPLLPGETKTAAACRWCLGMSIGMYTDTTAAAAVATATASRCRHVMPRCWVQTIDTTHVTATAASRRRSLQPRG